MVKEVAKEKPAVKPNLFGDDSESEEEKPKELIKTEK